MKLILLLLPGSNPEVFLDEVESDGKRYHAYEEGRSHKRNDANGGEAEQRGACQGLQGGGNVLEEGREE